MSQELTWKPEALELLKKIPFFVRPVAKKKIEKDALEKGMTEITAEFMEEVRKKRSKG